MEDSAKYLIQADMTANGVVERSDVVGAVFGQTEGLLGDELDLRDLQQGSKVGRIDVEVSSEHGTSTGVINIATSMDKVETAILAASLETIERVGPCRATVTVTRIEDVRGAKRREVVDRARELLVHGFDETVLTSHELVRKVRESTRVEDITEYEGYPAGPNVADSDAIIVVEGRADVLALLRYGIKNAIAVEGTDVPEAVADLTAERTVTAFLDGDRGGELILKELEQVGDVDYVAFAPAGRSVEDLERDEVISLLRAKVPHEAVVESSSVAAPTATDGQTGTTDGGTGTTTTRAESPVTDTSVVTPESPAAPDTGIDHEVFDESESDEHTTKTDASESDEHTTTNDESGPVTIRAHVDAVIGAETGTVRILDGDLETLSEASATDAFDALASVDSSPYAVVLDGALSQRELDISAQRGIEQIVARERGEFTKRPTSVRVRTADQLQVSSES